MKLMVLLASLGLASALLFVRLTALMPPQAVITRPTLGSMPSITPAPITTAPGATPRAVAAIMGK